MAHAIIFAGLVVVPPQFVALARPLKEGNKQKGGLLLKLTHAEGGRVLFCCGHRHHRAATAKSGSGGGAGGAHLSRAEGESCGGRGRPVARHPLPLSRRLGSRLPPRRTVPLPPFAFYFRFAFRLQTASNL